jgi:arylsulfatase A-like enzyme
MSAGVAPRLVVLISIDTLRADRLGVYGATRRTSPTLDLLASEGVVFEDASAVAPWTLPSHASLLTGVYPKVHGARSHWSKMSAQVPNLATLLGGAGYRTAAVVNSTYLKPEAYGVTHGFDDLLWIEEDVARRRPATLVTEQALEWIREIDERPLFLFIHYYGPHADYKSMSRYEEMFVRRYDGPADGTAMQLTYADMDDAFIERCRSDFDPEYCKFGRNATVDPNVPLLERTPEDVDHLLDLYDAGIRQVDDQVARIVGALRSADLLDETFLIVTSDHGEEFMDHGGFAHSRNQYQEVLHVPLIMRGRGLPPGRRISAPVSLVDVVPTVLAQVGVATGIAFGGRDLSPLFSDGPAARETAKELGERYEYGAAPGWMSLFLRPEVSGAYFPRSVRQGRYKLHYDFYSGGTELYDLSQDPHEQVDISEQRPELVQRLASHLRSRYRDLAEPSQAQLEEGDLERLRDLGYVF